MSAIKTVLIAYLETLSFRIYAGEIVLFTIQASQVILRGIHEIAPDREDVFSQHGTETIQEAYKGHFYIRY